MSRRSLAANLLCGLEVTRRQPRKSTLRAIDTLRMFTRDACILDLETAK